MPTYRCTYLDARERKICEDIQAESISCARDTLRKRGCWLLDVREKASPRLRYQLKEILLFSKQLRLLLASGLPLYESLQALYQQEISKTCTFVIMKLIEDIRAGGRLSDGLSKFPELFDAFYVGSIVAGENTGDLVASLDAILRVLENRQTLQKKLQAALMYPLVLSIFALGTVLLLLLQVVPSLRDLLADMEINGITKCVLGASQLLCRYGWVLLGTVTIASLGMIRSYRRIREYVMNRVLSRVRAVRYFLIKLDLGRFFLLASSVLAGGGDIIQALRVGQQIVSCTFIRQGLSEVLEGIVQGQSLSQALAACEWVPRLAIDMVALGESHGALQEVLNDVSRMYYDDVERTLAMVATWSQPVMLILLGGMIGCIMLAILMPLTSGMQGF